MGGFWDFLLNNDKKSENIEERSLTRALNIGLHGFLTGVSDDLYTSEQVLSIPVALACTNLIVNSIKNLPIELYERINEDTVEQITNDYRLKLLNDAPNMISTGVNFKSKLVQDLILHGNAYVEIVKEGNIITSLWNIDASNVGISKFADKEKPHIIKDVKFKIYNSNVELGLEDMMVLTESSEDGGLTGQGVIARGYRTIELALNEIELNKNIMNNGSSPISVVKLDKNLSAEAQQRLRDSWDKMYASSQNAGKLLILEQGMEYEKLSFSPNELGLTASRTKTQADMCALFGVPESMVDSSANTYGNIESSNIRFLQYSILPHLSVIESALNKSLLLEKEKNTKFFKINSDAILQTTAKERYETLRTGMEAGIISTNEARKKENLKPLPTDFHRFSLGAILYSEKDDTLFIPNTGVVFDANNKEIISSPDLAVKGGSENTLNEQPENEKNIQNKEIKKEKVKVDDKDE